MNPKPFWPLNHFTVPVVIVVSKALKRIPREKSRANFNFVDVFGKGARGRVQQDTAANRMRSIYTSFGFLQGRGPICFRPDASGAGRGSSRRGSSSRAVARAEGLYRLTWPRQGGHVGYR